MFILAVRKLELKFFTKGFLFTGKELEFFSPNLRKGIKKEISERAKIKTELT